MGWWPARDSSNRVPLENLYFNQPGLLQTALSGGNRIIRGKRASTGRGTPKNRLPNENKGPGKKHYSAALVENSRRYGYIDGRRIAKGKA